MADEAELTLVMKARNLASREVDKLHGSLARIKGSAGSGASALAGLGKTAAIAAAGGLAAIVGGLALATNAAAEEEVGIDRMNQAIKANDKSWTGNTAAIEALIAQREQLAFSDDDLRNSLTFLVTKTHDVSKAQAEQATAMDLARLKGISLQDASVMLTKGLDGNAKVLKQLGIDLPKTATEQERLTAIQAAAAGQAQKYGASSKGAMESFQIALGDTVEDIGSAFLPIMKTAFTWLRTDALPAVKSVIGAVGRWVDQNRPLINQIAAFIGGVLKTLIGRLGDVVSWIGSIVNAIASNKGAMDVLRAVFAGIGAAIQIVVDALGFVIGLIADVVGAITSNRTIMEGLGGIFRGIGQAVGGLVDGLKAVIKLGKDVIDTLANIKVPNIDLPHFAAGGWAGLSGPELAVVGEAGPEYIVPNHQLGMLGGRGGGPGGGAPVVLQLQVDGRTLAELVDDRLYYALQRASASQVAD